ncbi:glycosyltransferase family 1 protein [Rathayibacter sp. YIM 133350]|uniref:glycosyltransferase family 4 protein n=1 Tax=Rathayibacter sp. YIM 133350 TaxID=3131992 RepID=UPI00307EF67D
MTTLKVVLEQLLAPVPGGIGRYTDDLTTALIAQAPPGCDVVGIVSAVDEGTIAGLRGRVTGLAAVETLSLRRRELAIAWRYGVLTGLKGSIVHAPSLLAPLSRHERSSHGQVAVTIHDAVPWTHPETLTPHGVAWHRAMAERAHRHADAIIVPTHAVALELNEHVDFGDRVRVVGGAVSPRLSLPADEDARAVRLQLPDSYLLSVGTLEPRKGIRSLIKALSLPEATDLPLLVVGPKGWGGVDIDALAAEVGLPEGRVRALGYLDDADLAVVLSRSTLFVMPSLAEGFGLPLLEAMYFGRPVVHSDAPALVEVAGGAGTVVERDDSATYAQRLSVAITELVGDEARRARLGVLARDRARAYSWRDSADRVWQLHAEL